MSAPFIESVAALGLMVLGLIMGSFLNVVIARVPEGLSIVHPRSRCPHCGHQLTWYENIPVLSWLALRARCSSCRAPISWRYPAVELLTGLLFLACLRRFGWTQELVSALVLVLLLVPLTFIDLDHWILPFSITLPGIAAGLVLSALQGLEHFVDALLGALAGFLLFRLLEFVGWLAFRKEALGGGDKFLMALLGAFLTWKALLAVLFLSSLQGALVGGLLLLTTGRAGPAHSPPPEPAGEGEEPRAAPGLAPGETPPGGTAEPAPAQAGQSAAAHESTMSWEFLAPGLPLWRRLLLLPGSVLLQPIPDEPRDEAGEEEDWVPGPTNLPFGPWLALAALEVLLLGPWLAAHLPLPLSLLVGGSF
jgi:leader peptidase (prepilin peptidase) / N-methyltransferase